jgi:hypothetical protein
MIQPHGMADDLGGEAVSVARVRWRFHHSSFVAPQAARQTRLT